MSNQSKPNQPTHDILHVKGDKRKGERVYYTTIGAAWLHEDGKGLNLQLDFLPNATTGRIIIRVREDKPESQAGAGQ